MKYYVLGLSETEFIFAEKSLFITPYFEKNGVRITKIHRGIFEIESAKIYNNIQNAKEDLSEIKKHCNDIRFINDSILDSIIYGDKPESLESIKIYEVNISIEEYRP